MGLPAHGLQAVQVADRAPLLFIVDLLGGNDGLNTLIPLDSRAYRAARPTLAIDARRVLPLTASQALHPSLAPLMDAWDAGELAIVQGVGIPGGSGSHTRAAEIIDSGSLADDPLQTGWLAQCGCGGAAFSAVSFGAGQAGLLRGIRRSHALAWCAGNDSGTFGFGGERFERALDAACKMLADSSATQVFHFVLPGFDTHENQSQQHARALATLARGLADLRRALGALGRWQHSVVLTRSEFGRMADENLSAGTDHGNASVQILMGGLVGGGLHGTPLDAASTDTRGRFVPSVDFRSAYATIARDLFDGDLSPAIARAGCLEGLIRRNGA